MRIEYRSPVEAYLVVDMPDGTKLRKGPLGREELRHARAQVDAEHIVEQQRRDLVELAEQARHAAMPRPSLPRRPVEMGLPFHRTLESLHGGMESAEDRRSAWNRVGGHPELEDH